MIYSARQFLVALSLTACAGSGDGASAARTPGPESPGAVPASPATPAPAPNMSHTETATFGAGCFWCVEAVLEQLPGVLDVTSGYMGGSVPDPTYEQVCSGTTGHAEVVQVTFDPAKMTYETLVDWFFKLHDPTTLNRQGPDSGTQYRSAIFWHSEAQREVAVRKKKELEASRKFRDPIVTEVAPAGPYYRAEGYHQDYYRFNKDKNPYCRVVITPKLDKLGLEK
jgi:peptide-methionine (S)-S-oxide reductase